MRKTIFRKIGITVSATALASAMVVGSVPQAMAAQSKNAEFWSTPSQAAEIDSNLLTTYGVRAGSAGPDFLGITNTNYDFPGGSTAQPDQYAYTADDVAGTNVAGLALWATSVNESPNPYYQNLIYNKLNDGTATAATTWMTNNNSWGDSNGSETTIPGTDTATIAGFEYQPDIIFGANKYTNWTNLDISSTTLGTRIANHTTGWGDSYNPSVANNDSTNLWSQVYTMNQLAQTADDLTAQNGKKTRYNSSNAMTSALAYEKALRGNLLWIASQIDQGNAKKKTVAYLYAIDSNDTGYFFIPEASGLINGNDTSKETTSKTKDGADTNYAANNGTIDLGYMDTLPFITNTFKKGTAVSGGIVMKVEDIYKSNPAVSVGSSQTDALANVDAIIFNTNTGLTSEGGSGGKNNSGITNKETLNKSNVETWAKAHGFKGSQIIAGDDFGTSKNQGIFQGSANTTEDGMSPLLYCMRNYTTDKPARAAWAYSVLYPELYPNADASYAYWVKNVYHINMADVPAVVKYLTNQSDSITYNASINSTLESHYLAGLNWWVNYGSKDKTWNKYAYYNGSSRASYYDTGSNAYKASKSEEPRNTIGIFAASPEWTKSATVLSNNTLKVAKTKVTVKKGKKKTVKVTKAKGKVTVKSSKKKVATVSYKSGKVTIKAKKKGKTTITVTAAGNGKYKAGTKKIKVTVK